MHAKKHAKLRTSFQNPTNSNNLLELYLLLIEIINNHNDFLRIGTSLINYLFLNTTKLATSFVWCASSEPKIMGIDF